jgi:hypothetical protein
VEASPQGENTEEVGGMKISTPSTSHVTDLGGYKFKVCAVPDSVKDPTPGALKEESARKYLSMGRRRFRQRVAEGRIIPRLEGKQRVYLTQELDAYLKSLPIDGSATKISQGPTEPVERRAT